jgi:hypothetical protein
MKEKIKVTIDRSKWRTGSFGEFASGRGDTSLLNDEGFMCCLGFCSLAVGVTESEMLNKTLPHWLRSQSNGLDSLVYQIDGCFGIESRSTDLSIEAAKINDSNTIDRATKEKQLLELFKDTDFDIEFIGDYTPFEWIKKDRL